MLDAVAAPLERFALGDAGPGGLAALGVQYVASATNFLLVELGSDAGPISDELLKLGVIIRPMRWMGFPNAIRVTVGTHQENEKFLWALSQVRTAAGTFKR